MSVHLSQDDVRKLSRGLLELHSLIDETTFVHDVICILRRTVDANCGLYGLTDLDRGKTLAGYTHPAPTEDPVFVDIFDAHFWDHPVHAHHAEIATGRAAKISDFKSQRQWKSTGLHAEFFKPLGLNHHLLLRIESSDRRFHGIGLARAGSDFTDRHRFLCEQMAPHIELAQARVRALCPHVAKLARNVGIYGSKPWHVRLPQDKTRSARARALWGISPRQVDVLHLAARGLSNKQIGQRLGRSEKTIEQHVGELLRRTGRPGRGEVIMWYWTEL